jgi:hypothetical protein
MSAKYLQSLYGALPRTRERLCGSDRILRAGSILSLFSQADPLGATAGTPLVMSIQTGHQVVEGTIVGHDHNGAIELHQWISSIRTGTHPTSTMYYPHNDVGPDLIFALKSTVPGHQSTILCVLQVRLSHRILLDKH